MMARANLGVDVGRSALRAAVVRKKKGGIVPECCRILPMAEGFFKGFEEPGAGPAARSALVESLRELLAPIAEGEERISLSLPDGQGRLCLVEMEAGLKNKEEGRELLRWRLKSVLPCDPAEFHLDFQILRKSASGVASVLVSLARRQLIETVQEVCEAAGCFPAVIDFHSLNCLNYYYSRLDWEENLSLMVIEDGTLSFFYFQDRVLGYHRSHRTDFRADRVFDDIRLSVIDCEKRFPKLRRGGVYLHTDSAQALGLMEGIKSLSNGRGVLLKTDLGGIYHGGEAANGPLSQNQAAAIGAALRLLRTG